LKEEGVDRAPESWQHMRISNLPVNPKKQVPYGVERITERYKERRKIQHAS
jgi:hypothetical protein